MSYRFAGFFVKPPINHTLEADGVWRAISAPFVGVGVRLPDRIGTTPDPAEVSQLLVALGLEGVTDWVYLTYDCWGGRIDSVYGLGSRGTRAFGPLQEDDVSKTEQAFVELMGEFGVTPDDALRFGPFARGFWGEG